LGCNRELQGYWAHIYYDRLRRLWRGFDGCAQPLIVQRETQVELVRWSDKAVPEPGICSAGAGERRNLTYCITSGFFFLA
jgi:hypothetical protein